MAVSTRLVCLDKDGTLVLDEPYNVDPDRMRPAPGAARAIGMLADAGYRLVVVTNQPGIATGRFAESALEAVRDWLDALFATAGARLAGFYVCPHDGGCDCRKPMPGMIARALREHDAEPSRSWMVGDILDDVEAGSRAGCRTALVDNGNETLWQDGPHRRPTLRAPDLATLASRMVRADR